MALFCVIISGMAIIILVRHGENDGRRRTNWPVGCPAFT
jgi:hypothetical protein